MKLHQQPHRSTVSDNNLIPMINVVFLLLIFFMVAGIVRISDPLPLKAPESSGDTPTFARSVLYVAGDGTLMLNDTSVTLASLEATLASLEATLAKPGAMPVDHEGDADIANHVPEGLIRHKPQNKPLLAIKADARVTVSLLRGIVNALRKAGLSRVELITLRVPVVTR